ncbi:hypothetical protein L227DRAFT_579750 [Lentinus tigrinus ALCF2SS1-6]|uniref:Uncharacterized protein n=2 Tax=Lentinus tigrinus TaxID=5365 RepID=A0A5C2RUH3_9APHY|nr:hypothetical protein L227DRAFT_579750 [Lentinus tigrinus ALCF2SS1-6]
MASLAQTVPCVLEEADQLMLGEQGRKLREASLPDIPDELSRHSCRVQASLKNITHFRVEYLDSYLHNGTQHYQEPKDIASLGQMTFSSSNDSEGESCGGGAQFRIHIAGDYLDFSVGWAGRAQVLPKATVTFDSPKSAYHDAASVDESWCRDWATSARAWEAKDGDGKPVPFTIDVSAESGPQVVYTIEQVVAKEKPVGDEGGGRDSALILGL